jgi:uncharacterized protein YutE (UPF0331/DUF86 family)
VIHAEKVYGILRNLDTYVGHLRSLAALDKAALLDDFTRAGSLRYYLQVSIECCLDLANHLIAAQALRPPNDYADAFAVLGEASLVPPDFVLTPPENGSTPKPTRSFVLGSGRRNSPWIPDNPAI